MFHPNQGPGSCGGSPYVQYLADRTFFRHFFHYELNLLNVAAREMCHLHVLMKLFISHAFFAVICDDGQAIVPAARSVSKEETQQNRGYCLGTLVVERQGEICNVTLG